MADPSIINTKSNESTKQKKNSETAQIFGGSTSIGSFRGSTFMGSIISHMTPTGDFETELSNLIHVIPPVPRKCDEKSIP
jgi:hypothetical protein